MDIDRPLVDGCGNGTPICNQWGPQDGSLWHAAVSLKIRQH